MTLFSGSPSRRSPRLVLSALLAAGAVHLIGCSTPSAQSTIRIGHNAVAPMQQSALYPRTASAQAIHQNAPLPSPSLQPAAFPAAAAATTADGSLVVVPPPAPTHIRIGRATTKTTKPTTTAQTAPVAVAASAPAPAAPAKIAGALSDDDALAAINDSAYRVAIGKPADTAKAKKDDKADKADKSSKGKKGKGKKGSALAADALASASKGSDVAKAASPLALAPVAPKADDKKATSNPQTNSIAENDAAAKSAQTAVIALAPVASSDQKTESKIEVKTEAKTEEKLDDKNKGLDKNLDGVVALAPSKPAHFVHKFDADTGKTVVEGGDSFRVQMTNDATLARTIIAQTASSIVGKRSIDVNGHKARADCSGTIRAVYELVGLPLGTVELDGRPNDTKIIYSWLGGVGNLRTENPQPGDLVFFDNTHDQNKDGATNDPLSHIGVVESVEDDGTVVFVHRIGPGIVRQRLNLTNPTLHKDPVTGNVINDYLRRRQKGQPSRTTGELFVGFGTVVVNDQVARKILINAGKKPQGNS